MNLSAEQAWLATHNQLRLQVTKATYDTWIKNISLVNHKNNIYTIGVNNNYTKDWLENRLLSTITQTLGNIAGNSVDVNFVVLSPSNQPGKGFVDMVSNKNNTAPQKPNGYANGNGSSSLSLNGDLSSSPNVKLRPNYIFERFVVGSSNRLAHAASLAVSERPGLAYNPLFLYGGVGLGKTHLLQAIAHKAKKNGTRIIYVSSETFTNDFINSIRRQTAEAFREHYRNTDFLLIDDIQFIAGKESTQEEFFHTFNDIHSAGGQIVLTSDRLPKAIPTLEERLSSRFEWGLLADIQPPDLETRLAILQFKADELGSGISYEVMEFIARRAQNNIRELEGALNKVVAHAALNREPITLDQAKLALQDLVQRRASITIEMVIEAVCEHYDLSTDDILSASRSKRVSAPRQMVMYLAREETKASLPQIGEALGGRDHTTIMYGYGKVSKKVERDDPIRRDAMRIRERLYQKVS